MKKPTTFLFKSFALGLATILLTVACSKDKENSCNTATDDYLGTYYGDYAFSVGGAKIKDTIVVTKGSNENRLKLYSHVMGTAINAVTTCEKFNIETFTGVKFSLDWAEVLDATGSGNGQFDKNTKKIKVAIKFSVVKADIGTGPAEYKNMIELTGDFTRQ